MSELKDGYVHKVHQIPRRKETVWPPNASWNVAVVAPIGSKRLVLNPYSQCLVQVIRNKARKESANLST